MGGICAWKLGGLLYFGLIDIIIVFFVLFCIFALKKYRCK